MRLALRDLRRTIVAFAIVAMLVLGACGDNSEDGGDALAATSTAPSQGVPVDSGKSLYETHCASCHGIDLRGTDKGPSHLSVVYEPNHHSDAAFLLAIRNGTPQHHWRFGDMEPIEGLSDADIAAITTYVREKQRLEGFEPYPP